MPQDQKPPLDDAAIKQAERAHTKETVNDLMNIFRQGGEEVAEPGVEAQPDQPGEEFKTPEQLEFERYKQLAAAREKGEAKPPESAAQPQSEAQSEEYEEIEVPVEDVLELENALADSGVELPFSIETIPDELKPMWTQALMSLGNIVQQSQEQVSVAMETQSRLTDFGRRLDEEPELLLLAVAATKPDVFQGVAELFQRMQDDPNVKQQVIDKIQLEAKKAELDRRDRVWETRQRQTMAKQLERATKQAAQRYGVPYPLAERMVASLVSATVRAGDMPDVSAVDGYVKELAMTKPVGQRRLRVATMQTKQAAETAAPVAKLQEATTPPSESSTEDQRIRGGVTGGKGGFRGLVSGANKRIFGG